MKKTWSSVVLAGLALCSLAWPAHAAEESRTAETVLVTAGRIAEKAKTVTQATTVISREDIEKNQHKTLEDVLRQNGVQIVRTSADTTANAQIVLRGMRSQLYNPDQGSVIVLIDGRRTASVNIAMIPMPIIERVEILRGPAAVQYGATAMGGVVNVITKRGGDQTRAMLELGGGSRETWKGLAGASGTVENFDYAFGVSASTRNGNWKDGDGHTIRNSDYKSMTAYSANLGYTFLDEHRIGASFIGADWDRIGDWGGVWGTEPVTFRPMHTPNGATPLAHSDRDNYAVDLNYEGGVREYGLNWLLRYSNAQENYRYVDPGSLWDPDPSTNKTKNQGTQAQLSWKYDFLTLTGGVDWSESVYRTDNSYSHEKTGLDNIGTFLLAKTSLLDDSLIFSLGARYDHYKLSYNEFERSANHTSLSAGAAYSPLDWLTLRANIGDSFRMPVGTEITGYRGGGHIYRSNSDLDPEKGLGWDAGFDVDYKSFRAGLTYFSTDYKDKIATRKVNGSDEEYYNLPGTSRYRGLEGYLSYDVAQAFDWPFLLRPYLTFTHMLKYEDEQGEDIQLVRDWVAGFGVNYAHPAWGLDVDLRFTWLGDQKEKDWNTNEVITTSGGVTVDLTATKQLYDWVDYGTLSVKGEINNLFNKQYALTYGYPMPGRSFFVSLIWQY